MPSVIRVVVASKSSRPVFATMRAVRAFLKHSDVVIVVARGMTEDEPASASMLRSAERYRSLFEANSRPCFSKDQNLENFRKSGSSHGEGFGTVGIQIVGRPAEQIYGEEAGGRIRASDFQLFVWGDD